MAVAVVALAAAAAADDDDEGVDQGSLPCGSPIAASFSQHPHQQKPNKSVSTWKQPRVVVLILKC